jgi:hypothetical protein
LPNYRVNRKRIREETMRKHHDLYRVTWFHFDPNDDEKTINANANTFQEALELIPHGPPGWKRYLISQGKRFVERGDPFGPRGMPAAERGD